jgi:ADP-heptose:LPS heptosyltransferase
MPEDFGKFAALIAGASLMICTESDAMHLAVALGTYLFTLFGATDPAKVLPVDQRFTPLRSPTGTVADIAPIQVLEKVWGK